MQAVLPPARPEPPFGYELWYRLKQLDLAVALLQAALTPSGAPSGPAPVREDWLVAYA